MESGLGVIFTIVMNTIFILNVVFLLQLLFGLDICQKKVQYVIIALGFLVMESVVAPIFKVESVVETVAIYGYLILCVLFLSKGHRIRMVLCTIPAILLEIQWTAVMDLIVRMFHLVEFIITVQGQQHKLDDCLMDIILFFILIFVLYQTKRKVERIQLSIGEILALTVFCVFSPMVCGVLELLEDTFHNYAYTLAWVFFMIVLNVAVFYGIIHRNYAKYYKELSGNFKRQFDSEYTYFKEYKKKQKDIVKFRHDYRNHMLLLESMLEKGEYEEARLYLNDLSFRGGEAEKQFITGNEIVDIILNVKQEQFRENQIEVVCSGGLEPLRFLENVDCCILFSNLIDNAIEANNKCTEGRHITIKSTHERAVFMIEVSNRSNGKIQREEDFLVTTKKDSNSHGIGTRNAFEVIRKYQGEYRFFIRESDFVIQMVFSLDRLSQDSNHLSEG